MLRPLMAFISKPWQMYPLGFLFGLGFDTATEIGLLGISASQASHAIPLWTIMVFPALFTAGMSLIDTTDGLVMVGAYGWAFVKPMRKLVYNLTITLFSILVALIIGALEALNLIAGRFALNSGLWHWVSDLNDHFGAIGCAIILALIACWGFSSVLYRYSGEEGDVRTG
jgi:high-affinity nickel-transport protein